MRVRAHRERGRGGGVNGPAEPAYFGPCPGARAVSAPLSAPVPVEATDHPGRYTIPMTAGPRRAPDHHAQAAGSAPGPAVSVIVPMYQSGATIAATIESALADLDASGIDGEVVIVNDGSTDDGPAIVEARATRDGRVRLIHRANGGPSAARNTGLSHARGRFVRFLDADDLAVPGGVAALIACAGATGAACGGQELIDGSGRPMGRELPPRTGPDRRVGPAELSTGNAMGTGAVLISRGLLGDRRFDESLPVCEDWDLWLRLAHDGVRFEALPAWRGPVDRYRVRPGSLSKQFELMHRTGALTLERLEGLDARAGLVGLAIGYGTMRALSGDTEAGLHMLRGCRVCPLSAAQLAAEACGAVLLGLGLRPEARGPSRAAWVANLAAWWEGLASASWADEPTIERAWGELSRLIVAPDEVAAACVRRARVASARSVVVVGMGKNGRRVADALAATTLGWELRDSGMAEADVSDRPVRWRPMNGPIAPDAAVIVTPERDGAIVAAVRALGVDPGRIVRWPEVLEGLAAEEASDVRLLRDAPPLPPQALAGAAGRRCA